MVFMRDPSRIYTVLKYLAEIWTERPNIRFCQLIDNIFYFIRAKRIDPFYVKDEEFMKLASEAIEFWSSSSKE